MAFGDSATLVDNFNRADEDPLSDGGKWTKGPMLFGSNAARIVSNQARAALTAEGNSYRNDISPGPNVELHVLLTFATGGVTQALRLYARLADIGSTTTDGYSYEITGAGDGTFNGKLYRIDNHVRTQLGSTVTGLAYTTGDKMGFEIIGSNLKGYRLPSGGSWTEVISSSDGTYSSAGSVAFSLISIVGDDFYAGTVTSSVIKAGAGKAAGVGAGPSMQIAVETGRGIIGGVGSGARQSVLGVTYVKSGYAVVGTVGRGVHAEHVKTGYGTVGLTALGTSGHATNVVFEGVVIAFGSTTLDPYPAWTRIDQ